MAGRRASWLAFCPFFFSLFSFFSHQDAVDQVGAVHAELQARQAANGVAGDVQAFVRVGLDHLLDEGCGIETGRKRVSRLPGMVRYLSA